MVRVIWLSANLFGYEMLREAIKIPDFNIDVIFTLSNLSPTKMYDSIDPSKWYEFEKPVCEISDINKELNLIRSYSPDLIVMCGWRQIIKKDLLDIPPKGIIGFHPTLLPQGRGPAPIINTILEGFQISGVTLYYISEGLDNGDVVGQEVFTIGPDDYARDIYEKVTHSGKHLVRTYFPMLVQGTAPCIPQDNHLATYFPKRTMMDNKIDFDIDSIDVIYKKIRAFSKPYKGAFIIKNSKKLIIWNAEISEEP
jgi:methionyl-tRNA formyltransferase